MSKVNMTTEKGEIQIDLFEEDEKKKRRTMN